MNQSMYDALKHEIRELKSEIEELESRLYKLENKNCILGPSPNKVYSYPAIDSTELERMMRRAENEIDKYKKRPPITPTDGLP